MEKIRSRFAVMGLCSKKCLPWRREVARDEDGDGSYEVHVNTMEGFWSLLRSWLRPHRGFHKPIYRFI